MPKKQFVAVVFYEEDDDRPVDLSELATWVEGSLGQSHEVKVVDVTTYHRAGDAARATADADGRERVTSARRVAAIDVDRKGWDHMVVGLSPSPEVELMLNCFVPSQSDFDPECLVGLSLDATYDKVETTFPAGVRQ